MTESYMDVLEDRADQEECYAWAVHEIKRLLEGNKTIEDDLRDANDYAVELIEKIEILQRVLRLMPKTITDATDEIERLRKENLSQRYDIMLLNSRLQTEHEIIRIKEGE